MSVNFTTPVGRLVQGSLYEPQTENFDGKPLTTETGEEKIVFYLGIAIPKGAETHWNQTEWGQKIYAEGTQSWPKGEYHQPTFAWKVVDGDSTIPNKKMNKPCDKPGHPGNWILNFSSSFPTKICQPDATPIVIEDYVKLGDYIAVLGSVKTNGSSQSPGVYLNHLWVAFYGYGERIVLGVDPKSAGFDKLAPPPQASSVPVAAQPFTPPMTEVQPHPAILNPPPVAPVAAPVRQLTALAKGNSYEQLIAAGWSEAQMIQYGLLVI